MEEVYHWREDFEVIYLSLFLVCPLCFVFEVKDIGSQLSALAAMPACCYAIPTIRDSNPLEM